MNFKLKLLVFLLLPLMLLPQEFASELPIELQIKLILTTMQYKTNLLLEPNEPFIIGLFHTNSPMAVQYANEFTAAFQTHYQSKTIFKRHFQYETINDIEKLKDKTYQLLIIAPDSDSQLPAILDITQKNQIVSATGYVKYLHSGITIVVGLDFTEKKPFLGINQKSALREQCVFSPSALNYARQLTHEK